MVAAVWGEWHISQLLDLNLRTLLADGNLPAFTEDRSVALQIYTRRSDMQQFAGSPILDRVRRLATVELLVLPEAILATPIAAHHHAWGVATKCAAARGSFVLYLPPDVAWSDGSFRHLAKLIERGLRAIFMTYLRVDGASFITAIRARDRGEDSLVLDARELVRLGLECLHPLMATSLIGSKHIPLHPEMLFWGVKDEGLLLRVLAREMFLFDPRRVILNEMQLVGESIPREEVEFVADSDELFAVSLAELGKNVELHMRPRTADPVDIGRWWLTYDSPMNDVIAGYDIRWHATAIDEPRWRRRGFAATLFVRRCAIAREGLRLRAVAHELGCGIAARVITHAVYTGALARAVRGRAPATVLLPSDAAFGHLPDGSIARLLDADERRELTAFIRAHCLASDRDRRPPAEASGAKGEARNPARRVGDHTVRVIETCRTW